MRTKAFFEQLAARLIAQGVPLEGTAAVQAAEGWVVVDYAAEGRLAYHRTMSPAGQYLNPAPLVLFEQGQGTAAEEQWLLEARWVHLPHE